MTHIWLVLAGVVAGIVLQPAIDGVAVGGAGTLCAAAVVLRRRPRVVASATVGLAACAGWSAATLHHVDGASLRATAVGFPQCRIEGRVLEHDGGLGTLIAVESAGCAPGAKGTAVVEPLDVAAGTRVTADGWLGPLGSTGFDRARARLGADAEMIVATLTPGEVAGTAHASAERFRTALEGAAGHLSPEREGLVLGMTIGDTSALPPKTMEELRRAGLTHLLAVSGSNVAIALGIVALFLRRLPLAARIGGSALALALYLLVVGPEPSVLRAGAMGAIALVALWQGLATHPLRLLGLGLVVIVLLRPALVYAAGLHLSAAATAGIVLWAGRLADRCARLPRPLALALGATLAAQFAVAPVLLVTFGEVSVVAPVANVAAFPVVPPITVIGLFAGIVSLAAPGLGRMLMSLISPLAGWVVEVGAITGGASWASATLPEWCGLPAGAVVLGALWRTLARPRRSRDVAPRDDAGMGDWRWRLHGEEGDDLRLTEDFATKEDAEAWMGNEWQSLVDEGAASVSLMQDDVTLYTMGLAAE